MEAENGRLSDFELGELAAFADGSLPPAERARVAERIDHSPHLLALVAQQRASVTAVALLDAPAPSRLHEAVAAATCLAAPLPVAPVDEPRARRRPRMPHLALAGGLATALATGALAVVVVAGAGAPTIGDTVELAERGASASAPAVSAENPAWLVASVDGVAFPNYPRSSGWRRSGERADEIDGRDAATVYYRRGDQEAAYSIVSGEPLEWPAGARLAQRDGIEVRSLEYEGATVVTWLRDGHTCVIWSEEASTDELLELAAWSDGTKASA